jgi:hypothetical protein
VVRKVGACCACASASLDRAAAASGGVSSQRWRPLQAACAPRHLSPVRLSASPPPRYDAPTRRWFRPAQGCPPNISRPSPPERPGESVPSCWRPPSAHRRSETDEETAGMPASRRACPHYDPLKECGLPLSQGVLSTLTLPEEHLSRSLSRWLTYAPPRCSLAVPSSQLSRGRIPSSVSGVLWRSSGPPSAQSPFAWDGHSPPTRVTPRSPQRALPLFPSSYGLMRQTMVLPTPRWSLGGGVRAGCRESLLDRGPSRHYLCHLCGGAWTHTPPCSSGAHTHFFPNDSDLTSRETRSAHGKIPARRFQQGALFRGCSHSLMFRPRGLLPPRSLPPPCLHTGQPWRLHPSRTPVVTGRCIGYARSLSEKKVIEK